MLCANIVWAFYGLQRYSCYYSCEWFLFNWPDFAQLLLVGLVIKWFLGKIVREELDSTSTSCRCRTSKSLNYEYNPRIMMCYTKCSVNRLRSSDIRCMKIFFNYPKYYSVTAMLLELGLPSFDTLLYNSRVRFGNQVQCSQNSIIAQLRLILWFACVCFSSTLYLYVLCLLSLSLLFYLICGLVPKINYRWWWLMMMF